MYKFFDLSKQREGILQDILFLYEKNLLYLYDKYGRIKSVEDVKTGIKLLRGVPLGDGEPKNVRQTV